MPRSPRWHRFILAGLILIATWPVAAGRYTTDNRLVLTPEEQQYLSEHPVIKIASDPDWEPFEFIDKDGKFQGIAADYAHWLEQQLGIQFELTRGEKWRNLLPAVISGERPVVLARHATDERRQYMNFTRPYLFFPVVIAAREGEDYVGNPEQLNGRVIAGVTGFNASHHLAKSFPHITILDVDTVREGLEAVITGKAYGFVANLGSINYAIKRHGLDGLQIIGQTGAHAELAIGVHKNEPILFNILQKALANMPPEDASRIYDKWFHLRTVNQLDNKQLISLGGTALGIALFLIAWIVWFRYQRNQQKIYIDQINEYNLASLIELKTKSILWSSQSYATLVGCDANQLVGKNFLDFASKEITPAQVTTIEAQLRAGQSWRGEIKGISAQGAPYWVILTLTPQRNWLGQVIHVWATRTDITDKKRIEQLSIVDELTGLYNRRYFNQQLELEIRRAKRENRAVAMAIFDIDHFKLINDTYGHQQGDEVLTRIAQLTLSHFHRASDAAFRIGGEEFMVISHFNNAQSFYDYLEGFRVAVLNLNIENKHAPLTKLSISIGACYWQTDELFNTETLYHIVDQCLYQAKNTGRDRLIYCDSTRTPSIRHDSEKS